MVILAYTRLDFSLVFIFIYARLRLSLASTFAYARLRFSMVFNFSSARLRFSLALKTGFECSAVSSLISATDLDLLLCSDWFFFGIERGKFPKIGMDIVCSIELRFENPSGF